MRTMIINKVMIFSLLILFEVVDFSAHFVPSSKSQMRGAKYRSNLNIDWYLQTVATHWIFIKSRIKFNTESVNKPRVWTLTYAERTENKLINILCDNGCYCDARAFLLTTGYCKVFNYLRYSVYSRGRLFFGKHGSVNSASRRILICDIGCLKLELDECSQISIWRMLYCFRISNHTFLNWY